MTAVGQHRAYRRVPDLDSLGGRQVGNGGMGWEAHSGQGKHRGKGWEAAGEMEHGNGEVQVEPGACSVRRRKRPGKAR